MPDKRPLFECRACTLSAGTPSHWRINAESLDVDSLAALAELIAERVWPFGKVEGVPNGGLALAAALRPMAAPGDPKLLIVDVVLTTGGAMTRVRGGRPAIGFVLFDRSPELRLRRPEWIGALWTLAPLSSA